MSQLAELRKRQGVPFDLVVFSACRTALGDADAELFGLALQAGARSAIGTLCMSTIATSPISFRCTAICNVWGIPKAEAVRQAFENSLFVWRAIR